MEINNHQQITPYTPPTIQRQERPKPPVQPEEKPEQPAAAASRDTEAPKNPLAALFGHSTPAAKIAAANRPIDDQQTKGRFLDVIA